MEKECDFTNSFLYTILPNIYFIESLKQFNDYNQM